MTEEIAYTAVINEIGEVRVGIAKKDEPGYYQISDHSDLGGTYESMDQAQETADLMNDRLGLTKEEATKIVLSSMRAQNEQDRRKR